MRLIKNFSLEKYKSFFRAWLDANISFWKGEYEKSRLYNKRDLRADELYGQIHREYCPIFVLSTGRCGTKLLTKVLELSSVVKVYHDNVPELTYYAGYAFKNHQARHHKLMAAIDLARYEQIRDAFLLNQTYIETNNRITFFCYQLAELYPNAKFIHLYRDAYKVVQSGYSRGWYKNDKLIDEGRITLDQQEKWAKFDQVEKIAWAWNATNQFIEDFKKQIQTERIITIKAENLFTKPKTTLKVFDFMNIGKPSLDKIKRTISSPINKQKTTQLKSLTEEDRIKIAKQIPLQSLYYG